MKSKYNCKENENSANELNSHEVQVETHPEPSDKDSVLNESISLPTAEKSSEGLMPAGSVLPASSPDDALASSEAEGVLDDSPQFSVDVPSSEGIPTENSFSILMEAETAAETSEGKAADVGGSSGVWNMKTNSRIPVVKTSTLPKPKRLHTRFLRGSLQRGSKP